jgi:hypothetical protein
MDKNQSTYNSEKEHKPVAIGEGRKGIDGRSSAEVAVYRDFKC